MQWAAYSYIAAAEWLAGTWPNLGAYAIVKEAARGSWRNIERCRFARTSILTDELSAISIGSKRDIESGLKRLYVLHLDGVAAALEFVARNGASVVLPHAQNGSSIELVCKFRYFVRMSESDARLISEEAVRVRALATAARQPGGRS